MHERSVNWCGTLSERVLDKYATTFTRTDLIEQSNLFAHRAALFYTPPDSIPEEFIGSGSLDITIPIVPPDFTEIYEFRSPKSPRFWVDLIQRQTMKIRWKPFKKSIIRITRYDYYAIRDDHFAIGAKALLDALKERTSGRVDGKWLYYFGAIEDDSLDYIELERAQICVDHPAQACTRIQIDAV